MFAFSSVLLCGCEALAQSAPLKIHWDPLQGRGERPALVGVGSHMPELTALLNVSIIQSTIILPHSKPNVFI